MANGGVVEETDSRFASLACKLAAICDTSELTGQLTNQLHTHLYTKPTNYLGTCTLCISIYVSK